MASGRNRSVFKRVRSWLSKKVSALTDGSCQGAVGAEPSLGAVVPAGHWQHRGPTARAHPNAPGQGAGQAKGQPQAWGMSKGLETG